MIHTYWLAFSDPDRPWGERFRGVVILDLPELDLADKDEFFPKVTKALEELDISFRHIHGDPHKGTLRLHIDDVTKSPLIAAMIEHKGKLLTDDALLLSLGSIGRVRSGMQ